MTEQPGGTATPRAFRERLYTPWWWYPAGVVVAVLLGLEFAVTIPRWWAWLVFGLLVLCSVAFVWRFSSGSITVDQHRLVTGEHTLDLSQVERAIGLSADELRRLVGRHGDPSATVYIRSWVGPGVQLVLRDEPDIAPYWVVSSRHPDRLLAALAAAHVPVS